jgi:NADPH:quinone reductase-like Zn-dependent oxidoreductase
MNGQTAVLALDALNLVPGQTIAVTGAAGAVGGYVVELAKHRGLRVIADSSVADEELVRGFGADWVVPRGASFAAAVRELVPEGVPGVLDGSVQGAELLPALAEGGVLAVLRPPDFASDGVRVQFIKVSEALQRPGTLAEVCRDVDQGHLTPRVAKVLPLASASEAHRLLEQGGVRGRIVLTP